jgi:omega-6 fatty acid desaturase (delta-12 desaturase)
VPYVALYVVMYLTLDVSRLLTAALAVPAAGFLVRVFVVFHDCAHGSLFPSKRADARVGTVLGLLVLSPFRRWRHDHAVHHATSGDLERRGTGDMLTLTVAEYHARSGRGRLAYRLIRNPLVMFGLGPEFAMIIGPPIVARDARPRMRNSVLGTDAALLVLVGAGCWLIGWKDFLIVWTPAALLAGSAGIWLFYVQHQFETASWQSGHDWSYLDAAMRGSSYLKLPKLLQFFTGNIGLHHVHHLNARIPNYNLQRAHDANPMFAAVRRSRSLTAFAPSSSNSGTGRQAGSLPSPKPAAPPASTHLTSHDSAAAHTRKPVRLAARHPQRTALVAVAQSPRHPPLREVIDGARGDEGTLPRPAIQLGQHCGCRSPSRRDRPHGRRPDDTS